MTDHRHRGTIRFDYLRTDMEAAPMVTKIEQMSALGFFKDWSNYLLVTTVAAAGWVTSDQVTFSPGWTKTASLWSFGIAIIFGIFTLALIPLVAQALVDGSSMYEVPGRFRVLRLEIHAYLGQVCRPQHLAFIAGILFYCAGTAHLHWAWVAAVSVAVVIVSLLSKPWDVIAKRKNAVVESPSSV